MVKLSKVLSSSSKSRRHRRNILNIQITILAWLVEFTGGFLIFLGSFILRHQNSIVTLSLQTFTFILYFVLVPSIFLINDPHFKGVIIESKWYATFLNIFSCFQTNTEQEFSDISENQEGDENDDSIDHIHSGNENKNFQNEDDHDDDITSSSNEDSNSKAMGHTRTANDSFHDDESECAHKTVSKLNPVNSRCETTSRSNDIKILDLEQFDEIIL
jgi:hypothetical protein